MSLVLLKITTSSKELLSSTFLHSCSSHIFWQKIWFSILAKIIRGWTSFSLFTKLFSKHHPITQKTTRGWLQEIIFFKRILTFSSFSRWILCAVHRSPINRAMTHTFLTVCLGLEMYKTTPDRSYTLLPDLTHNNHNHFLLTLEDLMHSCWCFNMFRVSTSRAFSLSHTSVHIGRKAFLGNFNADSTYGSGWSCSMHNTPRTKRSCIT